MSLDFNNPQYPNVESKDTEAEKHLESDSQAYLSNVENAEHPFFSSSGILNTINTQKSIANSKDDKELTGKIPDKVIEDIAKAAKSTKCPMTLLLFVCDWEKKITDRKDASDAAGFAKKLLTNINELRSSLKRDPMIGEIFASHILGSVNKVKELYDKSTKEPDKEVEGISGTNANTVMMKNRNDKEKKRTNLEAYDFFLKRITNGRNTIKEYVK